MTLDKVYKTYSSIKEIKLIEKQSITDGKICEVMGFYLCNGHLQLLLLEYAEKQLQRHFDSVVSHIKEIIVDGISYEAEESSSTSVSLADYENTLIFSRFFEKGWKPQNIGKVNIENCFLCTIMCKGKFGHIPKMNDRPRITLKFYHDQRAESVEHPLMLEVGKKYDEKIYFISGNTKEEHWVYINDVRIYDMHAEIIKSFEDPKLAEQFSKEKLMRMKSDTEKHISQICPKGKGFLSIEYESDCDRQINFCSRGWLERKPDHKNGATGFIATSDKKVGELGKCLRVALIEEPLDLDVQAVEAQICSIYKTIEKKAVEL